jgi:hypothetical protein
VENVAHGIISRAVLTTPALRLTLFHFAAESHVDRFSAGTARSRLNGGLNCELHCTATSSATRQMRIVVYILIALILTSLGSALVFVFRDRSGSKRAVKALAVRVALSITLFLFLLAGFYFGFIPQKL